MYISYLDSSGRSEYSDRENYVLSSVTVNEHQWHHLKKEIEGIKKKHFPDKNPNDVELHAKEMMNRSGIYKDWSWNKIFDLLDDFFDFMANENTIITIIATLIKKTELHKKIDVELWGHRFLFERLNSYLQEQNKLLAMAENPHEYGITIIDTEGPVKDQKLRNKLSDMLIDGTHYSDLNFLIEDPLFTDSKWRNLSQVVDCVAYCIRKHYRENNNSTRQTEKWDEYFTKIEKKIYHKNGNYLRYGLKIFPE